MIAKRADAERPAWLEASAQISLPPKPEKRAAARHARVQAMPERRASNLAGEKRLTLDSRKMSLVPGRRRGSTLKRRAA